MISTPIPLLLCKRDLDSPDEAGCLVIISADEVESHRREELGALKADFFGEVIEMFKDTGRGMYGGTADVHTQLILIRNPAEMPAQWRIDYDCDQSKANAVRISVVPKKAGSGNVRSTPPLQSLDL